MKTRLMYNDKCKKNLIQNQIKIKQNRVHSLLELFSKEML